jgi:hypothetical protein
MCGRCTGQAPSSARQTIVAAPTAVAGKCPFLTDVSLSFFSSSALLIAPIFEVWSSVTKFRVDHTKIDVKS